MAKSTASGGDTPERIALQLAMAFGQGAGTMPATPEALWAAHTTFEPAIKIKLEVWPEIELQTIEFARALGRLSAFTASSKGRVIIDVEDIRVAAPLVRGNKLRPLVLCSLTPFKMKLGDVGRGPGE